VTLVSLPPNKDDVRKNAIVESGKDLPEGNAPMEAPIKYHEVICPKCRARPGYPCTFGMADTPQGKKVILDVWSIHIARVMAWEAYAAGQINELAIDAKGHPIRGGIPE
jgi:hypothetical protein